MKKKMLVCWLRVVIRNDCYGAVEVYRLREDRVKASAGTGDLLGAYALFEETSFCTVEEPKTNRAFRGNKLLYSSGAGNQLRFFREQAFVQ